eukprot:1159660-Pelagomonas_calceolata.AAC.10
MHFCLRRRATGPTRAQQCYSCHSQAHAAHAPSNAIQPQHPNYAANPKAGITANDANYVLCHNTTIQSHTPARRLKGKSKGTERGASQSVIYAKHHRHLPGTSKQGLGGLSTCSSYRHQP